MSFESFYAATSGIGDAYAKGLQGYQKRTALAKLGEQIQGGDINGAAQVAYAAGDTASGLALSKLGFERERERNQQANVGLLFGGAAGGGLSSGMAPLGTVSKSLPAFAQAGEGEGMGAYLASTRAKESGGNDFAQNPNSSALGRFQFTKGTWDGLSRQYPDLGLTANGRTDPGQQERAMAAFTRDNAQVLSNAGIPINPQTLYGAHFLGAGGATRFIRGAANNPDAPAFQFVDESAARSNRSVFFNRDGSPRTAGEVFAWMGRGQGGGRPAGAPARAPVQFANNEAETQALEARMGMLPPPQQVARYDARADMPAEGAVPMGYQIPEGRSAGRGMVGGEDRSDSGGYVPFSPSAILSGQAQQRANPAGGASAMDAPPAGRAMTLPPVQMAQAGGVPTGAGGQPRAAGAGVGGGLMGQLSRMSPNERVSYLLRAQALDLPEQARAPLKALFDNALQEARMPDNVKEYFWARANGMTQAASVGEYAREQKGPQVVAPGSSVLAPDGQSIALTVPDRSRTNVTDDVEARRQAAASLGLREGTPQFQSYVLTGKMPREDQQPLSASDKKAILEADDGVATAETAIGNLRSAKELSAKAYAGPWAGKLAWVTSTFGNEAGQATQELDNLVTTNALGQLKAIFGAAPTEGERKILLDIQGSSSLPHALRVKIYDRGIALAERRLEMNRERASDMRGQTYFRPDGGPRGSRSATPGGGGPALPPPSSANRPGAASAGDRFGTLVGSGMSREQAFDQMAREGY